VNNCPLASWQINNCQTLNIILILNSNSTILLAMGKANAKTASSASDGESVATGTARSAKGERARAGLRDACLRVLERQGYHKMRIADVTQEAGVAQGLFYHYFKDLKTLTLEVLTDFASASNDPLEIEKDVPKGDWYARIYAHNLVIVRSYARRPGVMRCLLQLADEDKAFGGLLTRRNRRRATTRIFY
jgi:AcrR family transcriptional regulator